MAKILVVLTGGTIGSVVTKDIAVVDSNRGACILEKYKEGYGYNDEFKVIQPFILLSENIQPSDWEVLYQCVNQEIKSNYDGIIITHGSDTLVYSAAFLGMMLGAVHIPVVFIAANYPLENESSNGIFNFSAAVNFIKRRYVPGVYVCYQNMSGRDEVYLSTRIRESDHYFDQYSSFDGQIIGAVKENGKFVWNRKFPLSAADIREKEKKESSLNIQFHYENEVMLIKMYPGINFMNFVVRRNVKAVLIYMYHSATAPVIIESGMLEFLRKCYCRGVEVYGVSFKTSSQYLYETSDVLIKNGLIPLTNICPEAAYCKLVIAYNQNQFVSRAFMKYNLFFEILE